jgi:DNA-binding transcriptional MerR regulator
METSPNQLASVETGRSAETESPTEYFLFIGDIAREFGVSLRALRFYEERGLLHPCRRGTTRLYSDRDRSHLQMILKGKQLGFSLGEIREFLTGRNDMMKGWALELNLRPDQIIAQISHLERQRANLDAALAELKEAYQRAQQDDMRVTAA